MAKWETEYQVIDDLEEIWYTSNSMDEAQKRMKEIASEPENEWLKFHIEVVTWEE